MHASNRTASPPRIGRWLVRLRPLGDRRDEVEADLRELFERRVASRGPRHAIRRYIVDALSLWTVRLPTETITVPAAPAGRRGGHLLNDLIFALRLFRRRPGMFGMAIGSLALAIGLSTAVFTFVYAAAFKGGGLRDEASLYRLMQRGATSAHVSGDSPMMGNWAFSEFRDVAGTMSSMPLTASMSEYRPLRLAESGVAASSVRGRAVTGNYFTELGGGAHLGRVISQVDDEPGAPATLVLSYAYWRTGALADPTIVGKTVWLGSTPYVVVGVASRGSAGALMPGSPDPPAFWIAIGQEREEWARRRESETQARRTKLAELGDDPANAAARAALQAELALPDIMWNPAVDVVGRLRESAHVEQAEAEITARLAALTGKADLAPVTFVAASERRGDDLIIGSVVLALVGLVVLLAAVNVTNVLLASAAGRAREIGTRLAIGASKGRVVRQLLTESLLLGAISGVSGFVLASWITPLFARLTPMFDLEPNPIVFAFVTSLTVIVGVVAGLAPSRYVRRGDLVSAMKTDRVGGPSAIKPGRLRAILVAAQAAASIVLLVMAALLTRSLVHASSLELGFDPDRVMTASVGLGRSYTDARTRQFWMTAIERIRTIPGVADAAIATPEPFSLVASHTTDGRYLHRVLVSPEYFAAMGQSVVAGRGFTADDVRSGARVAVISRSAARRYWNGRNPIGSDLEPLWGKSDRAGSPGHGLIAKPVGTRIIGVVSDTILNLENVDRLTVYTPLEDEDIVTAQLFVRTNGPASLSATAVRGVLTSIDVDPTIGVRVKAVREAVDQALLLPKILALLATIVGGTALLLSVVGLFGVTSFAVGQRQHEVGIRITLGATGSEILLMLVRDSLRPVVVGLIGGLAAALLLGRVLESALYGVTGHDMVAVLAAVAVLLGAALTAVLVPARRAAHVDPARMLREV